MPDEFWALTPEETELLLHGHYVRDMQLSMLVAAMINAHRDPKRGRPVKLDDVSVFDHKPVMEVQTPQQQAKILRAIADAFKAGTENG